MKQCDLADRSCARRILNITLFSILSGCGNAVANRLQGSKKARYPLKN